MKTKELIETFLQPYDNEVRYLQSFKLSGNKGIGVFRIQHNFYSTFVATRHFTAVELQLCLNQLLYVYFAQKGIFDFLKHEGVFREVLKFQNSKTFITEQFVRYKKAIDVSKEIIGEVELIRSKKIRETYFLDCQFNFNKMCLGNVKSIVKEH
ncbi:MAG: FcoT family thioesterase [Bacteroidota bacterium]